MKILITGNLGYIGTELTKFLSKYKNIQIIGYDSGFFKTCNFRKRNQAKKILQHYGDVRNFPQKILKNVDAIIHLAAISNDPIGNKFQKVTEVVNLNSSKKILNLAIRNNVKKFIFASSCSIYGKNKTDTCNERSKIHPLTVYAKSKVKFEKILSKNKNKIIVTSLRFATACGYSDRFRLDLVLNDFVTSAYTQKKIEILSDGKAWRPLIDVRDMCRAIEWATFVNKRNSTFVNVGSNKNNFNIKNLGKKVQKIINSKLSINRSNKSDNRSYKVDFSFYKKIAPKHYPKVTIVESIKGILSGLRYKKFKNKNFRNSQFMRLKHLEKLIKNKRLNKNLHWQR